MKNKQKEKNGKENRKKYRTKKKEKGCMDTK
jgi:hypothetical protein